METWYPPPWALPAIVIALVVPPFLGFALGGAALGSALGFISVAGLIVLAIRARPEGPIELARTGPDAPLLAIALAPIDGAAAANEIATLAEADEGGEAGQTAGPDYSVLVLAPVQSTPTQRWLNDEEPGRVAAQERLAVSVATLTAAGCHAEGRVVDQNPAQAIEDAAAQHGARRVVFVVAGTDSDRLVERLGPRLPVPVHRVVAGS